MFASVINEVLKKCMKRLTAIYEILYANDLALAGDSMKKMR